MSTQFKIVFFTLLFLTNISIGQKNPVDSNSISEKNRKEIVDFIQFVVNETGLRKDQKLALAAYDDYQMTKSFLEEFLIDTIVKLTEKKSNPIIKDSITGKYIAPQLESITSWPLRPKILTTAEINYMLEQKKYTSNFKWDNTIFNFNQTNNEKWYNISLPLFSMDKTKVVVTIVDGCKGLCGHGMTYLFVKKDGSWNKQIIQGWYH
jgi:hypothetical protein